MTLTLDVLPNPDSAIARLDPRWKLVALGLASLCAALLRHLGPAAFTFAGTLLLVHFSGVPFAWYRSRLGAALVFLLLFVVLLPFLMHAPDEDTQPGSHFSGYGLQVALLLCLKGMTILTLMLVLLATTPLDALLKGAHALRVPGLLVQLCLLAYRYLFLLAAELGRLRVALRVRGYRNRASRHCYQTVGHVAGTLLVRGYERSQRIGQAMRCRGFDGRFRSLAEFRTRPGDVLLLIVVVGGSGALLLWDRYWP